MLFRQKKKLCLTNPLNQSAARKLKNVDPRDFLHGPVAKTLRPQGRGPGFSPWEGHWILHATNNCNVTVMVGPQFLLFTGNVSLVKFRSMLVRE